MNISEGISIKKLNLISLLNVAVLSLIIIAIASSTIAAQPSKGNLSANFIDVGQGDSILLQFAGKNMLIDAGEHEAGPIVTSYLQSHGVKEINLLVATHPHSDHIGGLKAVLENFKVKQVLDSGQAQTSQIYENFLILVDQKNIPYKVAERGQTIDIDPAIKIEVLSPPATPFEELNDNSIVLKITYNKISFLLMSDVGFEAENSLLASGYTLKSDILKVGHHGSATSTGFAFLNKVNPAVSIIEVGQGNDYGHPKPATLKRLQKVGSDVYRTDLSGNIVVTTNGLSYSIITQKPFADASGSAGTPASISKASGSSPIASKNVYSGITSNISKPAISASSQGAFVGSAKSNKYHYPDCSGAKGISPENKIWFSGSGDARSKGYVPCGYCHPP